MGEGTLAEQVEQRRIKAAEAQAQAARKAELVRREALAKQRAEDLRGAPPPLVKARD